MSTHTASPFATLMDRAARQVESDRARHARPQATHATQAEAAERARIAAAVRNAEADWVQEIHG